MWEACNDQILRFYCEEILADVYLEKIRACQPPGRKWMPENLLIQNGSLLTPN